MTMPLTSAQRTGLAILALLCVYAFGAGLVRDGDAISQNLNQILVSPNPSYWLGTDHFGRDMWVRLAEALQRSIILAALCVLTSAVIGVTAGVLAATQSPWVDRTLDGIVTTILALPGLVLVLILAALAPGSFWMIYLAISLIQWIEYFRLSRAMTLRLAQSPAVESSRIMGFGLWYQFRRHYWPALAPQVFTIGAFGAANAILMMASLGFIYVGIQPPLAELGLMIVEHFPYYSDAPWLLAMPLGLLALLILACQLLGKGRAQ